MPAASPSPEGRLLFLDWLRILAFGLLVLYHTGMYYVGWDWHIKSPLAGNWLEPWMRLTSPWRLDLLFLVSGAATSFMLARDGATSGLLRRRARRLLLPLMLGVVLLVPPQSYLEVVHKWAYGGSYADFLRLYFGGGHRFCTAPGHCLVLPTWNHLWFLPYLFVYTVVLWAAVRLRPGLLDRLGARLAIALAGAGVLLWPVGFLVAARLLLQARFPDTHALVDDWSAHSHFVAMFLMGALLARAPRMWQRMVDTRWPALLLAVLAWLLTVGSLPPWGPWLDLAPWFRAVLFCVVQWCAIVAALGFARVHLNRDGPARRTLTEAVFPVYVLHQTVLILLADGAGRWHLPVALEGPLLVMGTFALCLAGFEVVRRLPWARPWFGLSGMTQRKDAPGPSPVR